VQLGLLLLGFSGLLDISKTGHTINEIAEPKVFEKAKSGLFGHT
jgi:hypothetical protein